jgi:hypothetical protein
MLLLFAQKYADDSIFLAPGWGLPVHKQYRLLAKGDYKYGIYLEALQ